MDFAQPVLMLAGGLIFTRDQAAAFDDSRAFYWISLLRQNGQLTVPEAQINEFIREALTGAQSPPLVLPDELQYQTISVKPQPCLRVKTQQRSTRLHARIAFDYRVDSEGCIVESGDPRQGIFEIENRRYISRDGVTEDAARKRLAQMGLKYLPPSYYEKLEGWDLAPSKLPGIVRELVSEGWQVEAEGKTFRNPGEMKIHVSSGIDWFELHGNVDFAWMSVKLPQLLAALKRGEQMVKLDDGTYGMLPEEWLNKYGLMAGLGETHDDHLRFKRTQVTRRATRGRF
jgi:hypothetical protein